MTTTRDWRNLRVALIALASVFFGLVQSHGQTVFSEGFESGGPGWTVSNGVWQIGIPTTGPSTCISGAGTQCAGTVLGGNYPADTDSRLVSPVSVLPTLVGGQQLRLRYQSWFSYSSGDFGRVQIQVFDGGGFGEWQDIGGSVFSLSSWSIIDLDLTAFAGETVRFGFLHTAVNAVPGGDESHGWFVDDVEISVRVPEFTGDFEDGWVDWGTTRGVWMVGTPTAGPSVCAGGSQCAGTNLFGNYWSDTDSRLVSAKFTLPPAVGAEEIHMRFQNWFVYSSGDSGQVQIQVFEGAAFGPWENIGTSVVSTSSWTIKDIDVTAFAGETVRIGFLHTAVNAVPGGDEASGWFIDDIEFTVGVPEFTGDFEDGWVDWGTTRGVWMVGMPSAGPSVCAGGSQCAGTNLFGNYWSDTDSRLVSATFALPSAVGAEEVHMRFQNWFVYSSGDSGQVQIQVFDGAAFGPWQSIGTAVVSASSWTIKDVDVTAFAGETVRIGFLHTAVNAVPGGDEGSGWFIDDIEFTVGVPEFTGDFEDGWVDWGATRGVWMVGTPSAGPSVCAGGSQCAGTNLFGNYWSDTDSRLVSATVTLPAAAGGFGIQLRYQNWYSYSSGDSGQVQIQTVDGTTIGPWTSEGGTVSGVSGIWFERFVDLTAYAGQSVRIGFLHTAVNAVPGGDESTGWYIDDVEIVADSDADFVFDDIDNCSTEPNTNQLDTDGDGIGNRCDPDISLPNDCVINVLDLGVLKLAFFSQPGDPNWNPDADFNGDNQVNAVDLGIIRDFFFSAPGPSGLPNICD